MANLTDVSYWRGMNSSSADFIVRSAGILPAARSIVLLLWEVQRSRAAAAWKAALRTVIFTHSA
jgi:hypothetical protein